MSENVTKRGHKQSEETKAKIAATLRGRTFSDETRAKMSVAQRGSILSAEHRAKLAAAQRGGTFTAEHKAKLSAAQRGRKRGPHTAATKAKISVAIAALHGELSASWSGDDVGYFGAHHRHGKVLTGQPCALADDTCKGPIQCAFNHDAPAEFVKWDADKGPYSPRVEDYLCLCASHHKRYDAEHRRRSA